MIRSGTPLLRSSLLSSSSFARSAGPLLIRSKATAAPAAAPAKAPLHEPYVAPTLNTSVAEAIKHIPGPPTYPIISGLPTLLKFGGPTNLHLYMQYLFETYGWVTKMEIMNESKVLLFHPDDIRALYASDGKYPSAPIEGVPALKKHLEQAGRGDLNLGMTEAENWRNLRTKLQKHILPPQEAMTYLSFVNDVTRDFSKYLGNTGSKTLKELLPRYTFEVIAAVLFGKRMGALKEGVAEKEEFIQKAVNLFAETAAFTYALPLWKYFNTPKFQKYSNNVNRIFEIGKEECLEFAANLEKDPKKYSGTFLGKLMNSGELELDAVVENVSGLFMAGVDTTSNSLIWMFTHLAEHPRAQEELFKELNSVLKGGDFDDAHLPRLNYLKQCIKESARLDPTAFGSTRTIRKDIALHTGHTIKAGTPVIFNSTVLNRSPKYFDRVDEFYPERWTEEEKAKRAAAGNTIPDHPLMMMPFSFGPRMCLGARLASVEIQSVLCRVVQDYKLSLAPNHPPIKRVMKLFREPEPYPQIIFTPRH